MESFVERMQDKHARALNSNTLFSFSAKMAIENARHINLSVLHSHVLSTGFACSIIFYAFQR